MNYTRHGYSKHPLYKVWQYMKSRCYNENDTAYHNYGGRGILMASDWIEDPSAFVEWGVMSGWEPGLSIDREDNDLGYSPDNCRFVTTLENNCNQRMRKDNTSGFHGVHPAISRGRSYWRSYMQFDGKRKEFMRKTPEEAAAARDRFIIENELPNKLSLDGGA